MLPLHHKSAASGSTGRRLLPSQLGPKSLFQSQHRSRRRGRWQLLVSRCFRLPELAFVAASFVGLLIYFHYFVGLKQFVLCLEQVHGAGREHMEKHEVQPGLVMGLLPPSNTEAGSSLQQQYTSIIEDKAATLGDVLLDKAWREEESPDVGRVEHLAQGRVRGGSREEENGPPRELTEPHPPCSRGVQPSEHRLFCCMGFFPCRNGKGSVPCARVNDDYCDCSDGSDEPGTSACSMLGIVFHCRGGEPSEIPTAFVDDGVCDCCDGTDEPPGSGCPDSCTQG